MGLSKVILSPPPTRGWSQVAGGWARRQNPLDHRAGQSLRPRPQQNRCPFGVEAGAYPALDDAACSPGWVLTSLASRGRLTMGVGPSLVYYSVIQMRLQKAFY